MTRTLVAAIAVIAGLVALGCNVNVVKQKGDPDADDRVTSSTGQALRCAPDDLFASAVAVCGDLSGAGSIDVQGDLAVGGDLSHVGAFDVTGAVRMGGAPCGGRGLDV